MSLRQIDDDTLLAYLDGRLPPERQAEVAALLESAPELQAELDALLRLQKGLRAALDAADLLPAPGPATWNGIVRRTSGRGRLRLRLPAALSAAATLLIVAAFAVLLSQNRANPTVGGQQGPLPAPPTAAPQGWAAVPESLRRGTLAYICDHQLCVLDMATGQHRQLTNMEDISAPAWSPDGSSILFLVKEQTTHKGRGIGRFDLATGEQSLIFAPNDKFQARSRVSWLDQHSQIADVEYTDPNPSIFPQPAGAWMATIANGDFGSSLALNWAQPQLAPDRRSVVFVQYSGAEGTQQVVRWLLPDGTPTSVGSSRLSPVSASTSYHWPSFSPDGQRVAYFARAADGTITLNVVAASGGEVRAVATFAPPRAASPAPTVSGAPDLDSLSWSPDGSLLATAVDEGDGRRRIRFITLTGDPSPALFGPEIDGAQPAWTAAELVRQALFKDATSPIAATPPAAASTALPAPSATLPPTGALRGRAGRVRNPARSRQLGSSGRSTRYASIGAN